MRLGQKLNSFSNCGILKIHWLGLEFPAKENLSLVFRKHFRENEYCERNENNAEFRERNKCDNFAKDLQNL